jgi:hypothetical protein
MLADKGARANVLLLVDKQVASLSILLATVGIIALMHLLVFIQVNGTDVVDESGLAAEFLLANLALIIFLFLSIPLGNVVYETIFMLIYY